ncbi:hypothetical protein [Paenibacillus ehimensis]|uniref:hypothetical protein n=1 Tax=Paenibacillus ehimensis TaxID=79264 RepID=UPI00046F8654|nr:hypothetical protein [Paenibacillus ehimensis]
MTARKKEDLDSPENPNQEQLQQPEKEISWIYCGPNQRGLLNQYTVYRGGLPQHLEPHFEKCPGLKRLIVPIEQFPQTEEAVKQPGTAENVWYQQVLEYDGGAKS